MTALNFDVEEGYGNEKSVWPVQSGHCELDKRQRTAPRGRAGVLYGLLDLATIIDRHRDRRALVW